MTTNFELVSDMNVAFGNPKGDPANIDWDRVRNQCKNIGHEFVELLTALGATGIETTAILSALEHVRFEYEPKLEKVRDALTDVQVFAYGGQHFMGIDGNRDMQAVIEGNMTRFIKDDADKAATVAKHAAKSVTEVYFEGEYPNMVMKSAVDQPDAPKGKFLKSASFREPVFYRVDGWERTRFEYVWLCNATGKYHYSDEAGQIDPASYETEFDAAEALRDYVKNYLTPSSEVQS